MLSTTPGVIAALGMLRPVGTEGVVRCLWQWNPMIREPALAVPWTGQNRLFCLAAPATKPDT
jgi:hypothetical protein